MREARFWRDAGLLSYFGHQPFSEIRKLSSRERRLLCRAVVEIHNDVNAPKKSSEE